jgi:hypothetical protein
MQAKPSAGADQHVSDQFQGLAASGRDALPTARAAAAQVASIRPGRPGQDRIVAGCRPGPAQDSKRATLVVNADSSCSAAVQPREAVIAQLVTCWYSKRIE